MRTREADELEDLRAENAELRALLRLLEWEGYDCGITCCPICGGFEGKNFGHKPDCRLATALREGER